VSEFRLERDMEPVVRSWLESQGLFVRRECWMPSGVCDLVGCRFREDALALRLATGLGERSTARSVRDIENGRPWLPLHERLVFVEMKLRRREEVWRQACAHQWFAESFVAMPYPACDYRPLNELIYERVGVLRVDADGVTVLREAIPPVRPPRGQVCRLVDSMALEAAAVGLAALSGEARKAKSERGER